MTKITQALQSSSPPIGILLKIVKDGKGETMVKALIVKALTDLAIFLNVGKNFDEPQIIQTTELIIEDFKHLKVEDFKLFFSRMKKGHYGKLYDRMDGQVILEHLHAYCHERVVEAEQISHKAHSLHKSDTVLPGEVNIEGQKKVVEVLKSVISTVEVTKKVEKPVREKSTYEKLIQRFFRQFSQIWLKWPYEGSGREDTETAKMYGLVVNKIDNGKHIKRYGIIIDEAEYVELKIKQHDRILKQLERRSKRTNRPTNP